MKILSLLGALLTTTLSACTPRTNVLNKANRKNLVADNDIVSISDVNNVIQISSNVRDNNMANCNDNVYHSITFIGNSDVHGFDGSNHITYQWSELTYDDLNHDIQTTNQDLGTYYFGFLDYKVKFYTNGVASRSVLVRQYFVNPRILTQGVYYIDDKTWYNLYDLTIQGNDNYECFGSWYSYYDYLNYQYDYGTWIVDDFVNTHIDFYIDTNFFAYQLPSNDLLEFAEPQRHYGDTYTINGSYYGQNLNSDYISFLPYLYFFFCDDSANLGDLYGMSNQLSLYHYKQDYLETYQNAYDEGYAEGNADGYSAGFQSGYDAGNDAGYLEGYDDGVDEGESVGYSEGYSDGTANGYVNGYNDGSLDANHYTFGTLFAAIADTPVLMFRSLFNFDIFGTSALVIILSLFTALALIFIAKKILK